MRHVSTAVLVVLAGIGYTGTGIPAVHPGLRAALGPGILLVATPQLVDPNFGRSVVLLIDHGSQGAYGVIINRRSDVPVHEVLGMIPELRGNDTPIFIGGPVGLESIRVLVHGDAGSAHSRPVLAGVSYLDQLQALRELLADPAQAPRLRFYAGYAGWAPGQLEAEVARGDWLLFKADAGTVFHPEPSRLWQRLQELGSGEWAAITAPWSSAGASAGAPHQPVPLRRAPRSLAVLQR